MCRRLAYGAMATLAGTHYASKRFQRVNLTYPADFSGAAESGMGWLGNHRLNSPAESTVMNVRGPLDTEASSRPVKRKGRRSRHSSRKPGKPATGRRAAVCRNVRTAEVTCESLGNGCSRQREEKPRDAMDEVP
jgi:hypothetical protein